LTDFYGKVPCHSFRNYGCYASTSAENRRAETGGNAMKRLAILTFALGVIVAPFQAHAQKPVEFNGMVFDPPPAQSYEAPKAPAPAATKSRTSTHQQHHSHS
jgi:hypothetical protein